MVLLPHLSLFLFLTLSIPQPTDVFPRLSPFLFVHLLLRFSPHQSLCRLSFRSPLCSCPSLLHSSSPSPPPSLSHMIRAFRTVCLCASCGRLLELTRPLAVPCHATLMLCQCACVCVSVCKCVPSGRSKHQMCVCLRVCLSVCMRVRRGVCVIGLTGLAVGPCHLACMPVWLSPFQCILFRLHLIWRWRIHLSICLYLPS